MQELSGYVNAPVAEKILDRLSDQVNSYEFEEAVKSLDLLCEALDIRIKR